MKKYKIKRILFYISLIPYAYTIIMSLYSAIFGFEGFHSTYYGLKGALEFLNDFYFNNIVFSWKVWILILLICYQIYYLLTLRKGKKETVSREENANKEKRFSIKKILFIISIMCWIIYFLSGIYAFFFGSNTGGGLFSHTMEYGIDALVNTLFWNLLTFSVIPVLPITLIYIIVFLIVKYKEKKKDKES